MGNKVAQMNISDRDLTSNSHEKVANWNTSYQANGVSAGPAKKVSHSQHSTGSGTKSSKSKTTIQASQGSAGYVPTSYRQYQTGMSTERGPGVGSSNQPNMPGMVRGSDPLHSAKQALSDTLRQGSRSGQMMNKMPLPVRKSSLNSNGPPRPTVPLSAANLAAHTNSNVQINNRPVTRVNVTFTSDIKMPYKLKLPTDRPTLRHLKLILPRKHNPHFQYYVKVEEGNGQYAWESVQDDNMVLRLCDGAIHCQVRDE
jgi:hypothetical protein